MGMKSARSGSYSASPGDPYSQVYSLQHHLQRMAPDEVFQYTVTAALLLTVLEKNTSFISDGRNKGSPLKTTPEHDLLVAFVGGLILRHLAQLVSNAHAVTSLLETEGEVAQVRLATGIYPSASMMNHSCVPAIINSFQGIRLVVRAVAPLSAGAEVTNCYGPHYRRHEWAERQEMLSSQYSFRCSCTACRDTKERGFFKQFTASKCQQCEGPVIEKVCTSCEKSDTHEKSCNLANLVNSALSNPENVFSLRMYEKGLSKVLYKHNDNLARIRDMLARAEALKGNFEEAEKFLRLSIATVKVRYGEKSIEYANELLKLSDIFMGNISSNSRDDLMKEVIKTLKSAGYLFGLLYGKDCPQYLEVEEKLKSFNM